MKKLSHQQRIISAFGSSRVFWGIVVLLIIQAGWIALSGRYPMAFDEDFHLGLIRLYAHHLSPFWGAQPPNADIYGAVARDPSYLYQYLMSFPYRLVSLFTHDQTIQVLVLRGVSIAIFASCLPVYRRLLLKTGASRALVNSCLLAFVLIPIVPLLAAQINYDSLFLPLVAIVLLLTVHISEELKHYKRINVKYLALLLIACLLSSLVKYAFIPIFLSVVIYLLVRIQQTYRTQRKFWLSLGFGVTLLTRRSQWLLAIGLILACGLFGERYGINIVRYHTPIPDCSKVLSVEACSDYGPWIRDYDLATAKTGATRSPLVFTADWFYGMWLRTFFTVDGPASDFDTKGPLVIPAVVAGIILPVAGVVAVVMAGRRVLRRYDQHVLWLFAACSGGYIGVLWLDEYRSFLRTGQPVAINGRYLLPVVLPLLVICGLSFAEALGRHVGLKLVVASIAILSLLWGGGALTYILRSNAEWYWPNSVVVTTNQTIRNGLGPLVPGYHTPTQFLR